MNYIDLGLPSGTLWADHNEGGFFAFDDAVKKYGDSLPTEEQLEELKDQCKWEWENGRYKVTGPNGKTIVLPAAGFRNYNGDAYDIDYLGYYWSSSPDGPIGAWNLFFDSISVNVYDDDRRNNFSVRLVK